MITKAEKISIPVAVSVKPVLALIQAYTDGDTEKFKEQAIKVAEELDLNGQTELALYIYAQLGMVSTFEVTD